MSNLKWLAGAAAATFLLAGYGARAQEDLGPIDRPISLLLLDKPTVTVDFRGKHGPVRVTGTLEKGPEAPLQLRSVGGPREARLGEIRSLSIVEYPREGVPAGAYQATLMTDTIPLTQVAGGGIVRDYSASGGAWYGNRLPEGELTLTGRPYGSISIPLSQVRALMMEPIRGTVAQFPQGEIQIEVLEGKNVNIPLPDVLTLQRDPSTGTATVTLADGQRFTGKLLEIPKVNLPVTTTAGPVQVPLSRVGYLERTPPGGRLQ